MDEEHRQFSLFATEVLDETQPERLRNGDGRFSNYIVYVDESGDHGIEKLDPNYPMFVLAFCIFHKRHYAEMVVPSLQKFKFNHFGHDLIVLHENEILKEKGEFTFFRTREQKVSFMNELTEIIEASNFVLVSCAIDKRNLRGKSGPTPNPYHIALGYCLETLFEFLQEKRQDHALTYLVVECRGKKEDDELELEFRRICNGANRKAIPLPFDIIFADKKVNSAGLQLADLVARPVGLKVLRPGQSNRAFEVLRKKFYCSGGRQHVGDGYENWGLKIYPAPESEKPR